MIENCVEHSTSEEDVRVWLIGNLVMAYKKTTLGVIGLSGLSFF